MSTTAGSIRAAIAAAPAGAPGDADPLSGAGPPKGWDTAPAGRPARTDRQTRWPRPAPPSAATATMAAIRPAPSGRRGGAAGSGGIGPSGAVSYGVGSYGVGAWGVGSSGWVQS